MYTGNSGNPSGQDSLHSVQTGSGSSVMGVEKVHLQCPVCQEHPQKEVYQCDEGHIVCHSCIAKLTRCPVCRADYPQKKIRCRVAETEFDDMKFKCRFRNSGCLKTNIPRKQRTSHEIQCEHNPSPPGLKLCCLFDNSEASQFRIDPNAMIQDPQHTEDVIEYLTRLPHNLHYFKVEIGEEISFLVEPSSTNLKPFFNPVVLFEVIHGTTRKTVGYYVLILRLSTPAGTNLSWAVVGLNSAPLDNNGANRHSDKITVKFSIEAKTDPNKVAKDGAGCVPDLSWTIKSMYLNEWEEFVKTPIEDRPPSSFSLPVQFLSEHYEQEDDECKMSLIFGPLVD